MMMTLAEEEEGNQDELTLGLLMETHMQQVTLSKCYVHLNLLTWSICMLEVIHSKKKSTSEDLFCCSRLSQIDDPIEYLEGPNSIPGRTMTGILGSRRTCHGPSRYYLVLPGTE